MKSAYESYDTRKKVSLCLWFVVHDDMCNVQVYKFFIRYRHNNYSGAPSNNAHTSMKIRKSSK